MARRHTGRHGRATSHGRRCTYREACVVATLQTSSLCFTYRGERERRASRACSPAHASRLVSRCDVTRDDGRHVTPRHTLRISDLVANLIGREVVALATELALDFDVLVLLHDVIHLGTRVRVTAKVRVRSGSRPSQDWRVRARGLGQGQGQGVTSERGSSRRVRNIRSVLHLHDSESEGGAARRMIWGSMPSCEADEVRTR